MQRSIARLLLLALAACGDSGHATPDGPTPTIDAATPDATPDTPLDAPTDTPDDPAPRIDTVLTSDGFHQLRQGETGELVIHGARFADASAVTLGALATTILETTDATLRVRVAIPHELAAQALALAVTTPRGTTTRPAAIDTTAYVITATAAAGGHGTTQSPFGLCDPAVLTAQPGDTLELAAGTYHCPAALALRPGVIVHGASLATTVLDGFGFTFTDATDPRPSQVAALSIVDAPGAAIELGGLGGDLIVNSLGVRGAGDGIRINALTIDALPITATIANLHYTGTGTAVVGDALAHILGGELTGCATGLAIRAGELLVDATRITGCTTGIQFGTARLRDAFLAPALEITDAEITGATVAIDAHQATATLVRTKLLACQTGARLEDGLLHVSDHSKLDCTGVAILADGNLALEDGPSVRISDSEVLGGQRGAWMASANDPISLHVRASHLHGGSVAAVQLGEENAACDLGTAASPGGNTLTSDTGFAFRDLREDASPNETTHAFGTTLNGHDYTGQTIDGPADLGHDYTLELNNRLVF